MKQLLKMTQINYADFEKVDIRVGTIIQADDFPQARKPSYKLKIDFGDLGIKNSSAQITKQYKKEALIGKQVLCVVNFPPKQIANFVSEVLTTGFEINDKDKGIILATVDKKVQNGMKLY